MGDYWDRHGGQMKEKIAKPLKLSDDWANNLYRNVVHVLAETEGMIPGGQAERVIQVIKALLKEEIKQVANLWKYDKGEPVSESCEFLYCGFERCRQDLLKIVEELPNMGKIIPKEGKYA